MMCTWRDYRLTANYQREMMLRAAQERLGSEMLALRGRRGLLRTAIAKVGRLLAAWGTALQSRYSDFEIMNPAQRRRSDDNLTAEVEKIFVSS